MCMCVCACKSGGTERVLDSLELWVNRSGYWEPTSGPLQEDSMSF